MSDDRFTVRPEAEDPGSRLREIFVQALTRNNGEARALYLVEACGDDHESRALVTSLLEAHAQAGGFLENMPTGFVSKGTVLVSDPLTEKPGDKIGRYKLLQQIGEGGCGVVYLAEQEEPVRRRVALKVIKLGMDTKSVIARFEAERQALAMMDHPNIARVLDAGATDAGRPYFVMELVRGIKITDYCDQHHLPTLDRLCLFIKVCQAIQHAHQKGIIHRDIKPSNILITLHDGVAVPKVIDFGIAKATTDQRLTDKTLFTALEQFIGTPAYMSPEQAEMSGLDIDTRSDIYSLGVLLYEMLTGKTPFDPNELLASGIDAMRKTIREKEPVRPSTRLTQELVAADANRRKSTQGLAVPTQEEASTDSRQRLRLKEQIALLRGDLDWIVMRCLEKDRARRYETAIGLAADVQRHLDNEPVTATPPSVSYRLFKLVRRNRLVFAAGGMGIISLLGVLAALSFALLRERALKSESARADSIATFVTGLLNEAVPRLVQQGNSTGVRALLESADRLVSATLTNSPAAELTVRNSLQHFYGARLDDSRSQVKQTDRMGVLLPLVTDDRLPPTHTRDDLRIDVAATRLWAGAVTQGRTDLEELAEEFRQRGTTANRARARTLSNIGNVLIFLNQPLEAEPLLAEAYRLEPGRSGPGLFWQDFAGIPYTQVLIRNGKYQLAEEVARITVNQVNAEWGKAGPWNALSELAGNLGNLYCYPYLVEAQCRLGRFQDAESVLEEQMGPGAARRWAPAQLRGFKALQLAVHAYSGQWREAAPGLIALATNSMANVGDWRRGVIAALAAGDTNAYVTLCRLGRMRFAGNAEAETANALFEGLILRPQAEDLSLTLPDLLHRLEEGKDYHWSAAYLLFRTSQLAYRRNEYEEALRSLDAWDRSKVDRPLVAWALYDMQASALPDLWRAMILARLNRAEGARKAYDDGILKLRAGFPPEINLLWSVRTIYASHALRQEAREVLRSQGIAVPGSASGE
jgi:serine/threonine protein kinase